MVTFTEILPQMLQKLKSFLFTNQTTRQTVAKNTFWLAISQIGGRLLRALIIIYAARILGAGEWGVFSYAINLAGLLTILIDLGIGPILTREAIRVNNPKDRAKILSTAFFIKIALLTIGTLLVIFVAPRFTTIEKARILLPIVAFVLAFDTLREFGFAVTRALEKMEWEAGLYLLTNLAIVAVGALVLTIAPSVVSFTYAYAIGTGIGMIATLFTLRNYFSNLFSNFETKLIKPILASAWPFAISGVLGALMLNVDLLIIGFFRSAEEVGYYSAAERPILLLYIIPTILAASVFPVFSRLAVHLKEEMASILERVVSFTLGIALPIALGGFITGKALIEIIFGAEYLPGAPSFRILLISLLFNFPAAILINAIFAYNRQKKLVAYAALGGISNLILDLIFIPSFGIVGSAWATLIAQIIANLYLWKTLKRIQYFSVLPRLKKIIVATVVMTVATVFLMTSGVHLLITLMISIAIYIALLYVMNEPLLKEIKLILRPRV